MFIFVIRRKWERNDGHDCQLNWSFKQFTSNEKAIKYIMKEDGAYGIKSAAASRYYQYKKEYPDGKIAVEDYTLFPQESDFGEIIKRKIIQSLLDGIPVWTSCGKYTKNRFQIFERESDKLDGFYFDPDQNSITIETLAENIPFDEYQREIADLWGSED